MKKNAHRHQRRNTGAALPIAMAIAAPLNVGAIVDTVAVTAPTSR